MQTVKQKPAAPAATRYHGPRANPQLAITARELAALACFSADAGKLGVKMTDLGKGPFGVGALLKLSGKAGQYEVLVNSGQHALLSRVENGKRIRLCKAGTSTEASWNALLIALKNSEGRMS